MPIPEIGKVIKVTIHKMKDVEPEVRKPSVILCSRGSKEAAMPRPPRNPFVPKFNSSDIIADIKAGGQSLSAIARKHECSRQYIHQLKNRYGLHQSKEKEEEVRKEEEIIV